MYPGRVDDKGRVKLPTAFQQYFSDLTDKLGEKKLFVASLDRRIAQIYTLNVWRHNENFFDSYTGDPEVVENVRFNAQDLGAEAEMDVQGRITLAPELRRELGIENQPVRVVFVGPGRVDIYSEAVYAEMREKAARKAKDDVNRLKMVGLK